MDMLMFIIPVVLALLLSIPIIIALSWKAKVSRKLIHIGSTVSFILYFFGDLSYLATYSFSSEDPDGIAKIFNAPFRVGGTCLLMMMSLRGMGFIKEARFISNIPVWVFSALTALVGLQTVATLVLIIVFPYLYFLLNIAFYLIQLTIIVFMGVITFRGLGRVQRNELHYSYKNFSEQKRFSYLNLKRQSSNCSDNSMTALFKSPKSDWSEQTTRVNSPMVRQDKPNMGLGLSFEKDIFLSPNWSKSPFQMFTSIEDPDDNIMGAMRDLEKQGQDQRESEPAKDSILKKITKKFVGFFGGYCVKRLARILKICIVISIFLIMGSCGCMVFSLDMPTLVMMEYFTAPFFRVGAYLMCFSYVFGMETVLRLHLINDKTRMKRYLKQVMISSVSPLPKVYKRDW